LDQLSNDYKVDISEDWGWRRVFDWSQMSFARQWDSGSWTLDELEIVLQGVMDLANAMGGAQNFVSNMGGRVTISRKDMSNPGQAQGHHIWLRSTASGGFAGQWEREWTVVHELAHVWDIENDWQLSEDLETVTRGSTVTYWCGFLQRCENYLHGGTPPKGADQNFTRREDFAESVTAFVYPLQAQAFIQQVYANQPQFRYQNFHQTQRGSYLVGLGMIP
jgi:hypothetical protein